MRPLIACHPTTSEETAMAMVRLIVFFHRPSGRWNYKAPHSGAHRRSLTGFDTQAEAQAAADAADRQREEELANWSRDHPPPKGRKPKDQTVDPEKIMRGAKRRRCCGHGYSGGDGFKEI